MPEWRPGDVIEAPWATMRHHIRAYLHDDAAAREVGLKAGVIGGYNYLQLAGIEFERQFGRRWLERGRLTARWGSPVYEGDEVRALISIAAAGDGFSASFTLGKRDGEVVTNGAACWANLDDAPTTLNYESATPSELDGLRTLAVGEHLSPRQVVAKPDDVDGFCERTTDPFRRPDRVPTAYLARLLWLPTRAELDARGAGSGLFGRVDIRQFAPLAPGVTYGYDAEVLGLRRRGRLEILDIRLTALGDDGAPLCIIDQTQLFPQAAG